MGEADEYAERASECLEMARRAKTSHEKRVLLQIAKAWSELAKTGTITPPLALLLNLRNHGTPIERPSGTVTLTVSPSPVRS